MNGARFQSLLDRYFDHGLDPGDRAEFHRLISESEEARGEFWTAARWHASLRLWALGAASPDRREPGQETS